jgi:hypothetical protein
VLAFKSNFLNVCLALILCSSVLLTHAFGASTNFPSSYGELNEIKIEWTHSTVPIYKSTCRSQIVSQVPQKHSDGAMAIGMAIPFLVRYDRFRNSVINHKYVEPIAVYSSSQRSVGSLGAVVPVVVS